MLADISQKRSYTIRRKKDRRLRYSLRAAIPAAVVEMVCDTIMIPGGARPVKCPAFYGGKPPRRTCVAYSGGPSARKKRAQPREGMEYAAREHQKGQKTKALAARAFDRKSGTPGWIRTSGLPLRRRPLYPTELRGHNSAILAQRAAGVNDRRRAAGPPVL